MKKRKIKKTLILSFISLFLLFAFTGCLKKEESVETKPSPQIPEAEKLEDPMENYLHWVNKVNSLAGEELCSSDFPEEMIRAESGVRHYPGLAIVPCHMYAYQSDFVAVGVKSTENTEEKTYYIIEFPEYSSKEEKTLNKTPMELTYNEDTQVFMSFWKGRGSGDCGSRGTYFWRPGTDELEVLDFSIKDCEASPEAEWEQLLL